MERGELRGGMALAGDQLGGKRVNMAGPGLCGGGSGRDGSERIWELSKEHKI